MFVPRGKNKLFVPGGQTKRDRMTDWRTNEALFIYRWPEIWWQLQIWRWPEIWRWPQIWRQLQIWRQSEILGQLQIWRQPLILRQPQIDQTKPNLPNQTYHAQTIKPNQKYKNNHTKQNKLYLTKPSKATKSKNHDMKEMQLYIIERGGRWKKPVISRGMVIGGSVYRLCLGCRHIRPGSSKPCAWPISFK